MPWKADLIFTDDISGIGGLAAGLGLKKPSPEVGAGIQIAPHASRILGRLGLLEKVKGKANVLEETRYGGRKDIQRPTVIHRGDLQRILLDAVKAAGIDLRTSSRITGPDSSFEAKVQLEFGERVSGAVVIAADGVESSLRRQIASKNGVKDKPGAPNEESWTNNGNVKEMETFYKGWNDLVRNLLSYVPDGEVMEGTLNSHFPLQSWAENKCALMGDAWHPMPPYVAQGAAQAMKDAGVLTCALSLTDDFSTALRVYEMVRKERAKKIKTVPL
ncbi:hypothetical protein BDV12DRAFT_191414 [Aspergillus spectabilis]